MVFTQKDVGKKAPQDTVMEEMDSLAPGLHLGGAREGDSEEEDDDDGYVKDKYYKDGYYYDHYPNLLRVTKELEGKGKVGEPAQKSVPKPPRKDTNLASQPFKMQKATVAFEPGRPSAPRGKTMPKGQSTKLPKPKGQKNCPSNSINQDGRMIEAHTKDRWSTVDLRR
uniref:Uncharacterized protein n=1 Tax=Cannabis sativa TaxID=3483 RepID=A0A803NIL6_CANSA